MKKLLSIVILIIIVLVILEFGTPYLSSSNVSYLKERRLKSINLLEEGETVLFFSSNMTTSTSGNFFTNKRVATYWIYKGRNDINSSYYKDVEDIAFETGTDPYISDLHKITISVSDGSQFTLYLSGGAKDALEIFHELEKTWKLSSEKTN